MRYFQNLDRDAPRILHFPPVWQEDIFISLLYFIKALRGIPVEDSGYVNIAFEQEFQSCPKRTAEPPKGFIRSAKIL